MDRGAALPTHEIALLEELESLIPQPPHLSENYFLPLLSKEEFITNPNKIGFQVENNSIVGLSLRYSDLTALPDSIALLANLRLLDLTGNQLVSLPESIRELPRLEKLDLRWNKLIIYPDWLNQLEERGCIVFK